MNDLIRKANSVKGHLANKKTTYGTRRRRDNEELLEIGDDFVSDEARLLSSKSWRKLALKTQVFTAPDNPLIRTRQSHVSEVVAVSVVASELLGLNTNLVRAIATGHDIGHVPLGHPGEAWMAKKMGKPKFCHEIMGVIVAQKIERKGQGLNLTYETLDGMMRHSGNMASPHMTQEAWLVRYTDKFAYIFADINDIVERMKYPVSKSLISLANEFGTTQRERTTNAIAGLALESFEHGRVSFEHSDLGKKFAELRRLMYHVYPHVTQQNVEEVLSPVLEFLTVLNIGDPLLLLSQLTDKDVVLLADQKVKDMRSLNRTGLSEMIQYMNEIGDIDLCDPDLDW